MRKSIVLCLVTILIMGSSVFATESSLRVTAGYANKAESLFTAFNLKNESSCIHSEKEYDAFELVHDVICANCNEKLYEETHVDENNDMCCDACLINLASSIPSKSLAREYEETSTNEIKQIRKVYKASTVVPEISVEVLENGNEYDGKWTNSEIILKPIFTGNANVTAYQYKTAGSSTWTGTVTEELSLNSNFNGQIIMQGVDPAGVAVTKEFTTNTIKIDKTIPTISTITYENIEKVAELQIVASDDASGLKDYAVAESESATKIWKSILNTDAGEIKADVQGSGTYYVWVRDAAGNISNYKTVVVEKDVEAPTGTITVKEAYLREGKNEYVKELKLTLQVTVDDNISEASEIQMALFEESDYKALTDEDEIEWFTYQAENSWTLKNENVDETVYLILKDKAGNISKEIGIATPISVQYQVYHYIENIDNVYYSLYKEETKTGTARRTVELENERIKLDGITYTKGSIVQNGEAVGTTKIAADGTTEIHLYYSRNTATLTFNTSGGTSVSAITGKYGATITKPTNPTKAGYTFAGWTPEIPNIMPGEDMVIMAKWELEEYTITYNLDGGTVQGTNPASYNITDDDITLINPVRPGFDFLGWTGTDLTETTMTVTIAGGSNGDRTYTANWKKITLKLATPKITAVIQATGKTYNSGEWANSYVTTTISVEDIYGTEIESIQRSLDKETWLTFDFGGTAGLQQNGTTYTGREGWTVTDGRDQTWYIKAVDKLGNETEEYATFRIRYDTTAPEAPTYTAYYAEDETRAYTSGTVAYGPIHTLISAEDDKSGIRKMEYSFNQTTWTTLQFNVGGGMKENEKAAEGEEFWTYVDGRNDTAYFRATDKAGNVSEISAPFNIIYESEFEFTLDPTGGRMDTTTIATTYGSTYGTLPTPVRDGYTFAGWYKEATLKNKISSSTVVTSGPHTIYAKWTPITYNITYDLSGGTLSSTNPSTYTIESADITLKNPTKLGQDFAGWIEGVALTQWTDGFINLDTGELGADSNYPSSVYSELIKLKANTPYAVKGTDVTSVRWRAFDANGNYLGNISTSVVCTPSSDIYVRILFYEGLADEDKANVRIVPISYDTINWNDGFVNIDTGEIETSSVYPNSVYSDLVDLKAGVTYTLSGNSLGGVRWRVFDTSGNYQGSLCSDYVYTPSSDCKAYILLYEGATQVNLSAAKLIASTSENEAKTTMTIPTGSTGDRTYTATWVGAPFTVSYVDENNHIYNMLDVTETTTASSGKMKYTITDEVATVTALSSDGYGYINARVDLLAGTSYTFTCNTSGTYGTDTQVFLMLNGSTTHYYYMSSANYTFTPTTTGTYWVRLDSNVAGETHTFSNLCIKQNLAETKTVIYGDAYGTLSTVSRTGHTVKWYLDSALTTEITSTSTVTTPEDHNLYAKWTPITYTVTFNANGGSIADLGTSSTTRTVTYGKLYGEGSDVLPEATRTGYTFMGWYTATSGGTQITDESLVGTEVQTGVLYAQYLKDVTIASAEEGYSIYETTDKIPVAITTTYDTKGIISYNGTALTGEISVTASERTGITQIDTSSFYSSLAEDTLYYLDFKMTYPIEKEYKNAVAFKKTSEVVNIVGIETYIDGVLTTNDTIDFIENSIVVDNELSSTDSQITYKITMKNNSTTHYYKFRNMTNEANSNTSSTYTSNIDLADDINLDTDSEYTFEITYTYNSSISNNTHRQILTFVFEKSFEFTGTTQNMITVGNATNATQNSFGDFDVTSSSDSNHGTNYGTHDELYGDNGGKLEYNEEGALVLDSDNAIALLDIDQSMSVEDEYSLYMTIEGDTSQTGNGFPATIVSISEAASKYLSWVGFTKNYIHIYSYYAGSPKSNNVQELEQAGFVSFDVSEYSNKKMNIQIVATRGGDTKVYINGENVKTFSSGSNVVSYQFATIGDLRPGRNLKFTGLVYDIGVYNRALTETEVQENWNYANENFSIEEDYQ